MPLPAKVGRRVVVVGGGLTGLTTGYRIAVDHPGIDVTVLEAAVKPGGYLQTGSLNDPALSELAIDTSADAFLVRVPWARDLCLEMGLGDKLVSPSARQASLWLDGAMWPIPSPNVLGIPLDPNSVPPGLLSPGDQVRLSGNGVADRPLDPDADASVGAVVRACVGDKVFESFVDPLLGGINAGRADDLSCATMAPQLLAAARSTEGLLAGLRQTLDTTDPTAPVFETPIGGMEQLVQAMAAALGDRLQTGQPVIGLTRSHQNKKLDCWLVHTSTGVERADAVVLTVPAHVGAPLVEPHCRKASDLMASWHHASVVLTTMAYDRSDLEVATDQSGFLVGRGEGLLITACSFTSSKWAHLHHPDRTLLRVSCGRIDDERAINLSDEQLITQIRTDLATTLGVEAPPTAIRVGRFPHSLVQFPVGHADQIADLDSLLATEAPGLLATGTFRSGVGVPACIRSGTEAAAAVAG
ncbi:MAG: protoporphyrinogen oxidase [Acidimicrobiales bacterium]|nr:protoporphyrinogen oxidase [Acidimicrobiales bacterium]